MIFQQPGSMTISIYLPDAPLRGCPIEFYLFTSRLCVHVNYNHELQYANSGKVIWNERLKYNY